MTSGHPYRVLFVIGSMGGGGAERQLLDLIKHLDRSQFTPELYLAYRTGELLAEVPADVPIHAFVDGPVEQTLIQRLSGKFRMLPFARAIDLGRLLRRERYDLIFSLGLAQTYEAACANRRRQVPRIAYGLQDPAAELTLDFPHPTPWRWAVARWSYGAGSRIYANSVDLCRRFEEFYRLPKSSVEPFFNLRDFERLDRLSRADGPDWSPNGTRLVCVGRLERQKGYPILLEALADLVHRRQRDVQVAIVGQGSLEQELRQLAKRLQIDGRILWAGFQRNPFPFFRCADLFVLPSLWEGLPNVLIEALALGIPAIAADCPTGPREILEEGRWGRLVPPGHAAALADAIDQAIEHLPEEKVRARSASAAIRTKYDVRLGVQGLEARFCHVIESSRPPTENM